MRDRNFDGETNPPREETSKGTSDNRYGDDAERYTSGKAAEWVGITPQWVGKLSKTHRIGHKTGNYWNYSFGDIMLLGKLTRRGRKPMRNVTPPGDPELLLRQLRGQDELKAYMATAFRQIRTDLRSFIGDISQGLFNRVEKNRGELDHHQFYAEETLAHTLSRHREETAAAIGELAQRYEDARKEIVELRRIIQEKLKGCGRGVPRLGGIAPLLPSSGYEAEAA